LKLSNKKIKYIKRNAGTDTPEHIAARLKIHVKDVQRVLKKIEAKRPSQKPDTGNQAPNERGDALKNLIFILLICFSGLAVYANTFDSPFLFDDIPNIKRNPHVQIETLDAQNLAAVIHKSPNPRRPVANISFALNYLWGGYQVFGYHLVNLCIHLLNGILVYLLTAAVLARARHIQNHKPPSVPDNKIPHIALFAALIFICHPIQTQSVTYIVQRMNSMSTLFYLLAFYLYMQGRLAGRTRSRWLLYSGGLLAWGLALGSKEIAATLPLIILLYEWYFFQDLDRQWLRRNLLYSLGALLLVGLATVLYLGANPLDRIVGDYATRDFTMYQRVLTQFRVVVFYMGLLLWPHPDRLNLLHHITTSTSLTTPTTTVLSLVMVVGLLCSAAMLARHNRVLSFGILWFFLNLVIESSIIGLEMIFEHRLYLPMVGFSLILGCLWSVLLVHRPLGAVVLAGVLIISGGLATFDRNSTWQDEVTLWEDNIKKSPQLARPHVNLGLVLTDWNRLAEAIGHYRAAIRIEPDIVEALNNLGAALSRQNQEQEAEQHLRRVIGLKPRYAQAHGNLGIVLEKQGRIDDAIVHYKKSLQIQRTNPSAHNNLAIALTKQKRFDEAREHYYKAIRLKPDFPEAHNNLGRLLAQKGRLDAARTHFVKAVQTNPQYKQAYMNLGKVLIQMNRSKEALHPLAKALALPPEYASAYNYMGVALLQSGRAGESIPYFRKVLELNPDFPNIRRNLNAALAAGQKSP